MPALLVVLLIAVSANASAFGATVEGQLFDRDAQGLSGVTMQIVHVKSVRMPWDDAGRESVLAETRTGRLGMYEMTFDVPDRGKLFVRCLDSGSWDHRRYALPLDREVTADVRERERAVVSFAVNDAPGWAELQQAIRVAGGRDSKKGMILRSHGAPPVVVVDRAGRSEWQYDGVTYVFDQDRLVQTVAATTQDVADAGPVAVEP